MREIWSEQRKLEIWLQIELLATEALVAEGLVPKEDFEKLMAQIQEIKQKMRSEIESQQEAA